MIILLDCGAFATFICAEIANQLTNMIRERLNKPFKVKFGDHTAEIIIEQIIVKFTIG